MYGYSNIDLPGTRPHSTIHAPKFSMWFYRRCVSASCIALYSYADLICAQKSKATVDQFSFRFVFFSLNFFSGGFSSRIHIFEMQSNICVNTEKEHRKYQWNCVFANFGIESRFRKCHAIIFGFLFKIFPQNILEYCFNGFSSLVICCVFFFILLLLANYLESSKLEAI